MKQFTFLFFLLISNFIFAQENEDIMEPNHIKSVILKPNSPNNFASIVRLGQSFTFSFDDLEADEKDYYYKIEHFNYDWKSSNLSDREFITGYSQDRISNYENSFNTLQYYTHYSVTFPNRDTKLKISGNYKISVLNDDDEVIFTKRFVVYQTKVVVGVSAHRSRDISTINQQQNIQFSINHPNLRINNPKREIKTVLMQNNDWNTAIYNLEPQFFRGTQMLYRYGKEATFWAGNEFRRFDNKNIRTTNVNITRFESGEKVYNTILYTDIEKIDKPYTYYPDVNGNFVVRNVNSDNSAIEADYSWVYFTLESLERIGNKKMYVSGNFNDWRTNKSNEMVYDPNTKLYGTKILLKQGFYNYQYLTVDENGNQSNHDIDGSFFQTENNYTVLVYYRKFGTRYDSIIGYGVGNSEKLQN